MNKNLLLAISIPIRASVPVYTGVRILVFITAVLLTYSLFAQPTISNAVLPAVGDTIVVSSDNLPEDINISSDKGQQFWDLSNVQSIISKKVAPQIASKSGPIPYFPSADMVMENYAGVKNFYQLKEGALILLGAVGVDPYGFGIEVETIYEPSFSIIKTPLEFGTITNSSSRFTCTTTGRDLPISLLYSLPILPDSVRLISRVETSQEIDAWGHLVLPDNSFEVLRERRITATRTRIEIRVGQFPWRDVTDDIYTILFPKEKVQLSYHFYSNETVMPVAEAYMKPDGYSIAHIQYMVSDASSSIGHDGQPAIYVFPNPAIDEVRFELSNLPPASYTLKIVNILGIPIIEEKYQLSGFKTVKKDISKLRKGTYLYSLVNDKGKTIATQRLMVIRP